MFNTLFTGISGMNAMGKSLSVTGDNIANMNTIGFKSSKMAFSDILGSAMGVGGPSIGRGVMVSDVTTNYQQGSFEMSSNFLDMAVDGNGFFVVMDGKKRLFTRSGQFKLDREGKIINAKGNVLQGYQSDDSGNITETVGDLVISPKQKEAKATSKVNFGINFDAREKAPKIEKFDRQNAGTYNYSTQFVVYDSQGDAHQVTAYYTKLKPIQNPAANQPNPNNPNAPASPAVINENSWVVRYVYQDKDGNYITATPNTPPVIPGVAAAAPGAQPGATPAAGTETTAGTQPGAAGTQPGAAGAQPGAAGAQPGAAGAQPGGLPDQYKDVAQVIVFGQNGELVDDNSSLPPISFDFGTQVLPSQITFDYGQGTAEGSLTGFLGSTQVASDYAVHDLYQDGYTSGSLQNLSINKEGKISAMFSNGQTRILGQVVLAKFSAPTELARVGDNLLAETYASGDAIIAAAATNSLGRVLSNTLELSNVDLAEEFIRMISSQRAFQANTKTVTTTDEMLQELLTVKR